MKSKTKKHLILIDGSAMTYRAFFAFIRNPLRNSKGENVSAIFGVANSLLKILREQEFSHIAVCFDTPQPTFRHELYPEYKATREKMPDELSAQIPAVKELIDALGIPIIEEAGYEADDVIGTLTRQALLSNFSVRLISFDKDFYQLLTEGRVTILRPGRGKSAEEVVTREDVRKKLGIAAEKVVDYLALIGDTSDNIPGVTGVGPKTAVKLLGKFGSIENLIKKRNQIKLKKIRETLDEDQLKLSQRLATIDTEVKLSARPAALKYEGKDDERLRTLFSDLEFTSLMGELDSKQEEQRAFKVVSLAELKDVLKAVKEEASIEFLRTGAALFFAAATAKTIWIACITALSSKDSALIKSLLESIRGVKISSEVKELLHLSGAESVETKSGFFDIGLASYLLDPSRGNHNLDSVALRFEHKTVQNKDDLAKACTKGKVLQKEVEQYLSQHAEVSLSLFENMGMRLKSESLEQLYYSIEMPLIGVLARMEKAGILLDVPFFTRLSADYEKMTKGIEKNVYSLAGETFNIRSTKQLQHILFEKLKLVPTRKTKTGYSTDSDSLLALSSEHDLPKEMLRYRELYKLRSTYIEALPKLTDSKQRIHTTFIQTATATGRLSSRNPNLQNIPVRGGLGREIRKGFIAPRGSKLLSCDYSQIELRILAHLSGDEHLKDAFFHKHDIHARTAASVFGIPEKDITREMRRRAKIVNFGIIYGMSPYGLAQELDITPDEGNLIINSYFKTYPGVREWIERIVEEVRTQGYTETLLGRRRRVPEFASDNYNTREFGKRVAINTPVQGSAADIIKQAMIRIDKRLSNESVDATMVLQIHDELLFEVKQEAVDDAIRIVVEEMENVFDLSVPLVVDVGVGKNWFEAH